MTKREAQGGSPLSPLLCLGDPKQVLANCVFQIVFEVFANNIRIESLIFNLKGGDNFITSAVNNEFVPIHTGLFMQDNLRKLKLFSFSPGQRQAYPPFSCNDFSGRLPDATGKTMGSTE